MINKRMILGRTGWLGMLIASPLMAGGTIHLEWRPASQEVNVGAVVDVGLYAVSADAVSDPISVMDVILVWDPNVLALQGVVNNGPYTWLSSGFPPNAIGGLNLDLTDGDALYTARSRFPPAPSAMATSNGLLVTTVRFLAVAPSPATTLTIAAERNGAETIVISDIPGLDVHGTLGSAAVTVRLCGTMDADDDGDVDLFDAWFFQWCFRGSDQPVPSECECVFDSEGDHDIDLVDYAVFAGAWTGPL